MGPLLSASAGVSKRETPTSNFTESTDDHNWLGQIATFNIETVN